MNHRGRASARVLTAPTAIPPVVLAIGAWSHRWVSDDAFITFRSAANLFHGYGPVFNRGERIESSTSTLWEFVLAGVGVFRRVVPMEWSAVILGLAFSVTGLVFAQWAALRLVRWQRNRLALPLGALVVCGLAPFWDFATSGLEMGMVIAWLGTAFFALVRTLDGRGHEVMAPGWGWRGNWDALLIGLGVLIRPDLGIFVAGFAGALLVVRWTGRWIDVAKVAVWGATLPLVYEVFRMGYYAALVPTPAVAKEAGRPWWHQGWLYVSDFSRPYHLWFPIGVASIALIAAAAVAIVGRRPGRGLRLFVGAVPVVCGILSAVFVVRIGGDFMHGRLLLPATFALLLPVMAVPASRGALVAIAAMAAWAVPAATHWRVHYPAGTADVVGTQGITNERGFYRVFAHGDHPVTVADYRASPAVQQADLDRAASADSGVRAVVRSDELDATKETRLPLRPDVSPAYVVQRGQIGIYGYAVGPTVFIVDTVGLGDPLTARFSIEARLRPGHEKTLPAWWLLARFGDRESAGQLQTAPEVVDQARAALACGDLARLLAAVRRPLTVGRFLSNVRHAAAFDRLRISPDAGQAVSDLCGGKASG